METPIGQLWVAVSPRGLVSITRGDLPEAGPPTIDPDLVAPAVAELEAYFAGRLRDFSLPLDLSGAGAFDAAVWTAARQIPYGETASYGELAAKAGHPGAARAAGGSMSRCPLFPVVPCHRVIHADGSIRGWGLDLWIKRWMLDLEAGATHTVATQFAVDRPQGPADTGRRPETGKARWS
jgi:methylated-DNA-[protein]-cysteine S-methyltransferase